MTDVHDTAVLATGNKIPIRLNPIAEATSQFDRANRLRQQMDAEQTGIDSEIDSISSEMDDLQTQYEAKTAKLIELKAERTRREDAALALSDVMDAYDQVLRAHGVERPATP